MSRRLPSWRRAGSDRRGTASVEFAILLPLLAMLLLTAFDVEQMIRCRNNLGYAARTLADLVARQSEVTATTMAGFCSGSWLVMQPFQSTGYSAAVASVSRKSGATPLLDWQDTSCGNALPISDPVSSAGALATTLGDSVIVVRASYAYRPLFGYLLASSYTLSEFAYARPRRNAAIPHT